MKSIEFKYLIERLSETLTSDYGYTASNLEDLTIIFESPKPSILGDHSVIFKMNVCTCGSIPYRIGIPKDSQNDTLKSGIQTFISEILDNLLDQISKED